MHLKRMCANVAVFLRTMRIMAERNVICIMPRYDTETPDMLKHELMERMARLDEGVTRWKKSIIKKRRVRGTTGIEG